MNIKLGFEAPPAIRDAVVEIAAVLRARSPGQSVSLSDVLRTAVLELHRSLVQPVAKSPTREGTSNA
jgi:hypothetical protein